MTSIVLDLNLPLAFETHDGEKLSAPRLGASFLKEQPGLFR